jgi:hypothetical protein
MRIRRYCEGNISVANSDNSYNKMDLRKSSVASGLMCITYESSDQIVKFGTLVADKHLCTSCVQYCF